MLFQAVIGARLESPEDLCICPLNLAVAPGMSHKGKAELGADALTTLLEEPTRKLGPVVRNDTTWDPESADDRLEEGNNSTLGDANHRGGLRPLRELVDGDEEEPVPANGLGEWSQDIHPIRRMARRVESSAEPELVCVSALHGIDTPCMTLPFQLHPRELLASKSHAGRPYHLVCEMLNDFCTLLLRSLRVTHDPPLG
jgi:hypothetical protein